MLGWHRLGCRNDEGKPHQKHTGCVQIWASTSTLTKNKGGKGSDIPLNLLPSLLYDVQIGGHLKQESKYELICENVAFLRTSFFCPREMLVRRMHRHGRGQWWEEIKHLIGAPWDKRRRSRLFPPPAHLSLWRHLHNQTQRFTAPLVNLHRWF